MAKIPQDGYDILYWPLTETSGVYRNIGATSPNNAITDLTVLQTVDRNGLSPFASTCPNFPGTSNFPSGSSSTRNSLVGANTINPQPPLTVSCWVNVRSYPSGSNANFLCKPYRDATITSSYTAPFNSIQFGLSSTSGTWFIALCLSSNPSTQTVFSTSDFPIPLQTWCHIGFTYDGTMIKMYLNGNQMITYSGITQLAGLTTSGNIVYTDGTNGFGAWQIGATQSAGAGNKEEPNTQISDLRVANIVRPLSYFQNIYKGGALPYNIVNYTQYYKLRAYDTSCGTLTPVTWIDTEVSYRNAPAFPCSGPYSSIDVLDSWYA